MLENMLKEKNLPPFMSRDEMLDILLKEEYGYMPPQPESISYKSIENYIPNFCAGKAISRKVEITSQISGKELTFPLYVTIPNKEGKHPFFICINFFDCVPDRYIPVEEIVDNGFAVLSFSYKDVTDDNDDFTNGLAGVLYENGKRGESDPGKIAMWAWAAQRAMDYAQTLDCLDFDCSIVCGHSRLGKTALLTAATDERFKYAYSNNSGCSGAAISRGKQGERIEDICKNFPYWFCENYKKYVNNEYNMPFDQHYLVASIAPRYVYIASADEDKWADPDSEMLTCYAVGGIYEKHRKQGFVCEDRLPQVNDMYHEGCVGYHLRAGLHYFSREDWLKVIKFVKKHSCI
ncbi:MAG: hypothetical protein IJC74_07415 [Clostridia bacterium]|nr:hypothetical protein [Clostridia bacterium]